MKYFVFLASIEGDLIIMAGMSSVLKKSFPERQNILLLPKYPRVYARAVDYEAYFDKIIEVDAMDFSANPLQLLFNIGKIRKLFQTLLPYQESTFILFDIYNMVELAVYSFIRKNKKAHMVTVTAFEEDDIHSKNYECVLKGSIIKSIYSLFFIKKLFIEHRIKQTQNDGINYLQAHCHIQLCINNANYRNTHDKIFYKLPYTALFLTENTSPAFSKYKIVEPRSVILFVESQISHWTDNYWDKTNTLIEVLEKKGVHVCVKDHPNCRQSDVHLLQSKNIQVIQKEVSAELLYITNVQNILGVIGHGSTSLITASWLMIPSYDTSQYYGFKNNILERMSQFLKQRQDIVKITYLNDFEKLNFNNETKNRASLKTDKQIWKDIFMQEFGI